MKTKLVGSVGFAWICCMMFLSSCFGATYSIVVDGPLRVQGSTAFSIDVYLQETVSSAELTVLGDPTLGAISGNFKVSILGGSSALSKVNGNTAFDTYGGDATSGPWVVNQADLVLADGTPFGILTAPGVYRMHLGTILGISSASSEVFEFQISDPFASPSDDLVLGDANLLDGIVFPSSKYSLSVTGNSAVPEPSMCLIFGTALIAVPYGKCRKRRV